jgi:alkanesulfonate monooxygenase SsuD/methylene tetrahydromethanopterin reductase-like flavin-dependent oxidoreductase (luciferase family)
MKTIVFCGSVLRATPEEREARRPLGRDPDAWGAMVAEIEHIAQWFDQAGIDAFGMTEHHMQTEGGETMPNSLLLYTKLAALTERLSFMPLSLVLPARDPIRTAEDLAIFDHLHPGRLYGTAFARGYQTRWLQTLLQTERIGSTPMDPVSDAANRERFEELLEIVGKAWTEDAWNFDGKHYQVPYPFSGIPNWPLAQFTQRFGSPGEVDADGTIRKIGVVPKPLRVPQIFIPTTVSQSTIELCARNRYIPLIYRPQNDHFRAAAEHFRDAAGQAGRELRLGEGMGAMRKLVLGDTYEEAFEIAVRGAGYWHNNFFGSFGMNEAFRLPSDDPTQMLRFPEDRDLVQRMVDVGDLLIGTPEAVCEQLSDLLRCYGDGDLEYFVWEFWAQGLPGDDQLEIAQRQIEMFGQHIRPNFD